MRTALFLVAGFLLMGVCMILGRLFAPTYAGAAAAATWVFVALWLVISAANLWAGVAKAGYGVGEELPIFLLIFALPTAVAVLLKWKLS